MPPVSTFHLPNSLILLVHLHILEYPYSNRPDYDHDIFNPRTRGLRDRVKTMEDITYYLVGKLEGKNAKTILSTYPCQQPAASVAFRTSLAKYLENLRHQCIYPKGGTDDNTLSAWWWKDVVVRKSLLEECSGDKFERILLSLSTHTLMRTSQTLDPNSMSELLRSLPLKYSTSLKRYQAIRHTWTKSASLLTRAQSDIQVLRDRLRSQNTNKSTKYEAITTARLKESVDSAFQALLQREWATGCGKQALHFVTDLAGLKILSSQTSSLSDPHIHIIDNSQSGLVTLPPLPVAAAHHPAHLKRLRRPVFQAKAKDAWGKDVPPTPLRPHAEIIIATHLDTERRMYQTLTESLAKLQKRRSLLKEKVDALAETRSIPEPISYGGGLLWTLGQNRGTPLDLTPEVNQQFMDMLGFRNEFSVLDPNNANDDTLEKKIEEIRRDVLPPYPLVPDISATPLPPRDFKPKLAPKVVEVKPSSIKVTLAPASPLPPAMSPSKSARSIRRESVRFSMARRRTGRPSMFRVFSGQVNDEVDRLIDKTHDFPTDDEDSESEFRSPSKTPKGKSKQKVNRIWTVGTPMSAKRSHTTTSTNPALQSSAISLFLDDHDHDRPAKGFPTASFATSSDSLGLLSANVDDFSDEEFSEVSGAHMAPTNVDATPRPLRHGKQRRLSSAFGEDDGDEDGDDDSGLNHKSNDSDTEDVYDDEAPSLTLKEILLSADTSHFDLLEAADEEMEERMLTADVSFQWE